MATLEDKLALLIAQLGADWKLLAPKASPSFTGHPKTTDLDFTEEAAPASPAASTQRVYFDSTDHGPKHKDSNGSVLPMLRVIAYSRIQTSVASGALDGTTGGISNARLIKLDFTLPAAMTVFVSAGAAWNGTHANRLYVSTDGTLITSPNNGAGMVSSLDDGNNYTVGIPTLPMALSAGAQSLYLMLNAQSSFASVGLRDRWICVLG